MAHTPGPWKRDGLKVIANNRGTICVCPVVTLGGTFNVDANVSLIAAAPDMLKGLERAEQTIRNLGNGELTGDAKQIALNEAANLRDDIAKAKEE